MEKVLFPTTDVLLTHVHLSAVPSPYVLQVQHRKCHLSIANLFIDWVWTRVTVVGGRWRTIRDIPRLTHGVEIKNECNCTSTVTYVSTVWIRWVTRIIVHRSTGNISGMSDPRTLTKTRMCVFFCLSALKVKDMACVCCKEAVTRFQILLRNEATFLSS